MDGYLTQVFVKTVEYLSPTLTSVALDVMDKLQTNQNPPYSRGLFWI